MTLRQMCYITGTEPRLSAPAMNTPQAPAWADGKNITHGATTKKDAGNNRQPCEATYAMQPAESRLYITHREHGSHTCPTARAKGIRPRAISAMPRAGMPNVAQQAMKQ